MRSLIAKYSTIVVLVAQLIFLDLCAFIISLDYVHEWYIPFWWWIKHVVEPLTF